VLHAFDKTRDLAPEMFMVFFALCRIMRTD